MDDFKFFSRISDDPHGCSIHMIFEGMLTLQNAPLIKESLKEPSQDYQSVDLIAKDVTGIDVSFLNILKSFKEYLETRGKKVNVKLELPYNLNRIISETGISFPLP
jgi:MFS superfamily sulfate permease-like transporter